MSRHAGVTEVVVREKASRFTRPGRVAECASTQWAFSVGQLGPKLLVHHIVRRDLKSSSIALGDWFCYQPRSGFVWTGRNPFLKRSFCHLLEESSNNCTNLGRLRHTLGLCSAQLQALSWAGPPPSSGPKPRCRSGNLYFYVIFWSYIKNFFFILENFKLTQK